VVHLGKSMSPDYAREARALMRRESRYRWLGELPPAGAMRWLARSHAMVISSLMEGGAHVVSEAIAIGVPVIASAIPGNTGLLGSRYPGCFPAGDDEALSRLLARAAGDAVWRDRLEAAVTSRRRLVDPALERRSLANLVDDMARRRPVRS
jgi:glycosyltransferase involved in cell wall biosynthesis